MKIGKLGAVIASVLAGVLLLGCGDSGDGIKPEDKQALNDAVTIAKKVDGDYDKLSDADKGIILKVAGNDERQARTLLKLMAHPPNEAMKNAHGAPPGGAH